MLFRSPMTVTTIEGGAIEPQLEAAPEGLVWILSSGGTPGPGALAELLAAREEEGAEIATGVAVDQSGAVIRWLAPTARSCDTVELYEMLSRSRMPLVAAGDECLLVPRDLALAAFAGKAERYGRLAGRVAVAELLRHGSGVIAGTRSRIASAINAKPPIISQRLSRWPNARPATRSASTLAVSPDAPFAPVPRFAASPWRRASSTARRSASVSVPPGCAVGAPVERDAAERASRRASAARDSTSPGVRPAAPVRRST